MEEYRTPKGRYVVTAVLGITYYVTKVKNRWTLTQAKKGLTSYLGIFKSERQAILAARIWAKHDLNDAS